MFKPSEDRLNYSHLLTPPVGFEVEFAVGTTYSLDLEALVGVPMALFLSEEMDSTFVDNPIVVLEGLRKSANKFELFCEAGQIKIPANANLVFSLLEKSVHEVALASDKSFHPKVWLISYKNEREEIIYRLLVLSRNLTFDRSWDMVVALEGKKTKQKTNKNKPLAAFLSFLQSYTTDPEKLEKMEQLIAELDYVHFETGDKHYADFEFCPIGIEGYGEAQTGLFTNYHHMLIVSPFLSGETVCEINKLSLKHASKTLITRKSEVPKLNEALLSELDVYALKDLIIDGEEMISGDQEKNETHQSQDIHAKMYAKTKYNEHHVYIGSANCSRNAFHGNVEFLVKLTYEKRGFRITDLLADFFGEDEKENPFEKVEAMPEFDEGEADLTETLQKTIKRLCRTESKAEVIERDGFYDIKIHFRSIPEGAFLMISPLLREQYEPVETTTLLENLNVLELGEFYRVKAVKDGEELHRVIKIETVGIPAERDHEVFKTMIRDKHTFLTYVVFLLSDDYLLSAIEQMDKKKKGSAQWDLKSFDMPVLYEHMLKAVARSPEKFEDIENIINMVQDKDIVPAEFVRLYETFQKASKKVRR